MLLCSVPYMYIRWQTKERAGCCLSRFEKRGQSTICFLSSLWVPVEKLLPSLGQGPLLALETGVLVVEMGAGEGEGSALGQEAATRQQGAEIVLHQAWLRLGGDGR